MAVSIQALHAIMDYLDEVGIQMYRLSSDFVPYATHPDMPRFHGQIEEHREALRRVGGAAERAGVRLSLHPSQYVVLNAEVEEIRSKARQDLDVQARLLDALEQGPEAVVVLHVGGVYGDRIASRDRFVRSWEELSEPARRRTVVENDELCYTVEDCLWIHERTGSRVVFDHHHHRLNPGGLGLVEAAVRSLATWPAGVKPKIHFSSPRLDRREVKRKGRTKKVAPLLRQHADYVDPWTFAGFMDSLQDRSFDVMLEAKAKDLAVLKLREDLRSLGLERALDGPQEGADRAEAGDHPRGRRKPVTERSRRNPAERP